MQDNNTKVLNIKNTLKKKKRNLKSEILFDLLNPRKHSNDHNPGLIQNLGILNAVLFM